MVKEKCFICGNKAYYFDDFLNMFLCEDDVQRGADYQALGTPLKELNKKSNKRIIGVNHNAK